MSSRGAGTGPHPLKPTVRNGRGRTPLSTLLAPADFSSGFIVEPGSLGDRSHFIMFILLCYLCVSSALNQKALSSCVGCVLGFLIFAFPEFNGGLIRPGGEGLCAGLPQC
jgi:hypothetical protein